jgi:hypothetical protein
VAHCRRLLRLVPRHLHVDTAVSLLSQYARIQSGAVEGVLRLNSVLTKGAHSMIQAQLSSSFFTVFTWISIISLTFGFCASWSLHFVGMLSCKLDLPVELDVGLTLLSAVLAVSFTFIALGAELLWKRYNSNKRRNASRGGLFGTSARGGLNERSYQWGRRGRGRRGY